jgi:2-methylisocitrate lyase-like PEP mutase family enzyme
MSTSFQKFKTLHHADELFVLPNAWDARSAQILQEQKFPAIATSSAAVANSLGYDDGERMSFEEYLFVIRRIVASVNIPLTVDIETGYGATRNDIYGNLLKLIELGVAGINIEDSAIVNGQRSLQDAKTFAANIDFFKRRFKEDNLELFINVRCDTYILNVENKQRETQNRLGIYNNSGADGIFLPCIMQEEDIAEAVAHSKLPLNVMVMPGVPDVDTLNRLGVKRVSMGPFLFQKVYNGIAAHTRAITSSRSFAAITS